jgi:hypothetical protein
MKTTLVIVATIALAIVLLWLWFLGVPMRINTSFASEARLRGRHLKGHDTVVVTDAKDIQTLKDLLNGWAIVTTEDTWFNGDCDDYSITLTDGRKHIVFYPGCGEDESRLRVEHTSKYRHLSDTQNLALVRLCKKYGVDRP